MRVESARQLREAASEIVSVVRVKPHAIAIAPRHDAKAVVLDLRLLNPDLRLAQPLPRHFRARSVRITVKSCP
jgi:hypothetical protein